MKALSLVLFVLSFGVSFQASAEALVRTEARCESKDQRPKTCRFNNWGYGRVDFVRQVSNAPCIPGSSYFFDGPAQVTVTNGCRAVFSGEAAKDIVNEYDQVIDVVGNRRFAIQCESWDHNSKNCRVPWFRVSHIYLERQLSTSGAPCLQGRSYQIFRDSVQVWNGCRGQFRVQAW